MPRYLLTSFFALILSLTIFCSVDTGFSQTPDCVHDICTHDQWLSKWIASFGNQTMIPVNVFFKHQLTWQEIKADKDINSTGGFDLEGEIKLIESYGGKIHEPNTITFTNLYRAFVPKDKIFALENDPSVRSVDPDAPTSAAVIIPNPSCITYINNNTRTKTCHYNVTELIGISSNINQNGEERMNMTGAIHFKILSPLQQIQSGVLPHDVKCGQGFLLVIKKSYNFSACVKSQTAHKLAERGWAIMPTQYLILSK